MVSILGSKPSSRINTLNEVNISPLDLDWEKLSKDSKAVISNKVDEILNLPPNANRHSKISKMYSGVGSQKSSLESYRTLYYISIQLCKSLYNQNPTINNRLNHEEIKKIISSNLREVAELLIDKKEGLGSIFIQELIDTICATLVNNQGKTASQLDDYFNRKDVQLDFSNAFTSFIKENLSYKSLHQGKLQSFEIENLVNFLCIVNDHQKIYGNNTQGKSNILLSSRGYRGNFIDESCENAFDTISRKVPNMNLGRNVYKYDLKSSDINKYRKKIAVYLGQVYDKTSMPFTRYNKSGIARGKHTLADFENNPNKSLFCLEQILYFLDKTGKIDNFFSTAMLGKETAKGDRIFSNNQNLLFRGLYSLHTQVVKYNAKNSNLPINLADLLNKLSEVVNQTALKKILKEYIEEFTNSGIAIPDVLISAILNANQKSPYDNGARYAIQGLMNDFMHILDVEKPFADEQDFKLDNINKENLYAIYSSLSPKLSILKLNSTTSISSSDNYLLCKLKQGSTSSLQKANINILNSLLNSSFIPSQEYAENEAVNDICQHRDICIQELSSKYAEANISDNSNQESIFRQLSTLNKTTPLVKKIDLAKSANPQDIEYNHSSIIAVAGNKSITVFHGSVPDEENEDKFQRFETKEELENYLSKKLRPDNSNNPYTNNSQLPLDKSKISYYEINNEIIEKAKLLRSNVDIVGIMNKNDIDISPADLNLVEKDSRNKNNIIDSFSDNVTPKSSTIEDFKPDNSIFKGLEKAPSIKVKEIGLDDESDDEDDIDSASIAPLLDNAARYSFDDTQNDKGSVNSASIFDNIITTKLTDIESSFRNDVANITRSYEARKEAVKSIYIKNVSEFSKEKNQKEQEIRIKMVPLIPIAKQAGILNLSISDIDTSIKKLQELKKSLEDITQEYNDKKSNQDSKYKQAILNEKSQYIDSINYAKQHAQNQLKEFQDKLSNLTVFSTREINSIGRKIANYYINLDD
jgi:hypothetical protein